MIAFLLIRGLGVVQLGCFELGRLCRGAEADRQVYLARLKVAKPLAVQRVEVAQHLVSV